ncbi:MAG: lamin tail domain-containing protein [Bacteroidia bacterium]|nr:lamin tail domain-containing protein [Bacteroidia bacterium]
MKSLWVLLPSFLIPLLCSAQLSMTGSNLNIDFTGYDGSGFGNPPTVGQLSSTAWLLSETTNLSQGLSTGGETAAGFYSLDNAGDARLWFQTTGGYMTPGTISLVIQNNTAGPITELNISYDILVLNDQNRANSFNFLFSEDNVVFTPQAVLDFTSIEAADANPQIEIHPKGISLTGLNIPLGTNFALQWQTDDVSGIGSRDELGLDNVSLDLGPIITATELRFMNLPAFFVAGQTYELQVCATDAAGNVAIGNTDPISLSEVTVSGSAIQDGIQGAGCKTFFISPGISGPVEVRAANAILPDQLSGNIPIAPGSVFISEYVEGSGSNRCIEIYNATGADINLGTAAYELLIYDNGATSPNPTDVYPLTGILAAGDVFVVCNENAGPDFLAQADQTEPEGDFLFDGDDAIELRNNNGTLDFIGKLGEDPGTAWSGGGCGTNDETLIRNAGINFGDTDTGDAFDPSSEWSCEIKNTWAYLGYHNLSIAATELRIRRLEPDSTSCISEADYFAVEFCAFDAVNGFNDPAFAPAISLNSSGVGPWEIAGLNGGISKSVDENGCAVFYFRNFSSESFTITASASGVASVNTSTITIAATCTDARILQSVINPCGNETQNEFLSVLNGDTPLDLADMSLASVDHLSGAPQPNYNYTFNSTATATADNPAPCNLTDNVCLQWLNVNDANQRQMLINLRDELNTIAGCTIFEIPNQSGGTFGEIPAGARMMVFLGAGGNGTLGSEGFDDAPNNLDFASFCASGIQPVYIVVSTAKAGFGGYFSNTDARTVRMIINGSTYDVQGTDPSGTTEAEVINTFGEYQSGQSCVPPIAFNATPLPLSWLDFQVEKNANNQVLLFWETIHESNTHFFTVERKHEALDRFEDLGMVAASGNTEGVESYKFMDVKVLSGRNTYRIRLTDLDGSIDYSDSRELWVERDPGERTFTIYPQPARDVLSLHWESGERSMFYVKVLNLQGKILIKDQRMADPGANNWKLDIRKLAGGYYLLELMENGRSLGMRSLVKE